MTPEQLFWGVGWQEMTYTFTLGISAYYEPLALRLESTIQADAVQIFYQTDSIEIFWGADDALFWDPDDQALFWDQTKPAFRPMPWQLKPAKGQIYTFKLITASGATQGIIPPSRSLLMSRT